MRLTVTLLSIVFSLMASVAGAQDFEFMALGVKGGVVVDGEPLRVGATLSNDQSVMLKSGAYLGLAHMNGKTLEISKAGTYRVKDLSSKLSSHGDDLAGRYASFLISELTGSGKTSSANAKTKYGSVSRSLKKKPVQIYMPMKSEALKDVVTISWDLVIEQDGDAAEKLAEKTYKLYIKDQKMRLLMETEVTGVQAEINLADEKLKDQAYVFYYVEDVENKKLASDLYAFTVVNAINDADVKAGVAELSKNETAMGKMILAKFYEDNGYFANASKLYQDAIVMSGNDEQYVAIYENFKKRM